MTGKKYNKINNLKTLERKKLILSKKMQIRERLINKHIKDFSEELDANYILNQTLKFVKIDNPFVKFIPNLIKGQANSSQKGLIVSIASAIGTGLASFFVYKFKNKK